MSDLQLGFCVALSRGFYINILYEDLPQSRWGFPKEISGEVDSEEVKHGNSLYSFICENEVRLYAWPF